VVIGNKQHIHLTSYIGKKKYVHDLTRNSQTYAEPITRRIIQDMVLHSK